MALSTLKGFQSSFELTGYITIALSLNNVADAMFQSSFELTGYITAGALVFEVKTYLGFKALSSLQVI